MAKGNQFKVPYVPYYLIPIDEIHLKQKADKILLTLYKKQKRLNISFDNELSRIINNLNDDIEYEILLANDYLNSTDLRLLSDKLTTENDVTIKYVIDKIGSIIDHDVYSEFF